jgi:hypothetical protein
MKRVFIIVAALLILAVPVMAADFTGDFEYEVTLGEVLDADGSYGSLSLELAVEADEHNTINAEVSGDMGDPLVVDDVYLKTVYEPVTVQLGSISLDSSGWAITDDESESYDVGMEGDGVTAEVALDQGITFSAGIGVTDDAADFGGSIGFSKGALDLFEVSFFKNAEISALANFVVGRVSFGGGLIRTESTSFGGGAKVALGPAWIAAGANSDKIFVGDVGAEWDLWGLMLTAKHDKKAQLGEASVWWQPGGVKYKGGYRFDDRDLFVNVSAEF